jgi:hypothetical protein
VKFHELAWGGVACVMLAVFAMNAPAIQSKITNYLEVKDEQPSVVRVIGKNCKLEISSR